MFKLKYNNKSIDIVFDVLNDWFIVNKLFLYILLMR